MALCILICAACGQLNRAFLPAPLGKDIRCGNSRCRSRLRFETTQHCPVCERSSIVCDVPKARCALCNALFDVVPLKPVRCDVRERGDPKPGWLERLVKGRSVREAAKRDHDSRTEMFRRARLRYEQLLYQWSRASKEKAARADWLSLHSRYEVSRLHSMRGEQFEEFLQLLFVKMNYNAKLTPGSGDQGADLIVSRSDKTIAVQAKRQIQPVGNSAIQELLGGMLYYGCQYGIVVTNSAFTRGARRLAAKDDRIELWDGEKLAELYAEHLAAPPLFTWEEYERLKAALSSRPARRQQSPRPWTGPHL